MNHLSSAAKFRSPQTPLAWTSRDSPFDAMDKNLTKDATGSSGSINLMLVMSLRLRRIPGKHPIVGWNPQCRGMDVHPVKYGDKTLLTHPIQWNLSSLLIPSLCSPCNGSMVAPLLPSFLLFFMVNPNCSRLNMVKRSTPSFSWWNSGTSRNPKRFQALWAYLAWGGSCTCGGAWDLTCLGTASWNGDIWVSNQYSLWL